MPEIDLQSPEHAGQAEDSRSLASEVAKKPSLSSKNLGSQETGDSKLL
jgi:hypothetical protein